MQNNKIILASSSPRRIEILQKNGIEPIVIAPQVTENLPETISKEQAVLFLALKKALSVESALMNDGSYSDHLLIAADTIVYKDYIIGKPTDKEDAYKILMHLRKSSHYVVTGVAILKPHTAVRNVFYDVSEVFFKDYTEEALLTYITTEEPFDKAGGYAIQGTFGKYVDHIDGDIDNVIGLPWYKIQPLLK